MVTVEEIKKIEKENPLEFAKYASKVMAAWNGKSGKECNIVINNLHDWADFSLRCIPHWDWYENTYAIKEEPKTRLMTDAECRKFVIDNWGKIIIANRLGDYKPTKFELNYIECVIEDTNIAEDYFYCFKEDFNCEEPNETVFKKFEVTE